MGRLLRYIGIFLLAVTAVLILAQGVGWLEGSVIDLWIWWAVRAGVVCLGAGVLLAILSPVGGQTYCCDHLQAAVNEYRDQARDGMHGR